MERCGEQTDHVSFERRKVTTMSGVRDIDVIEGYLAWADGNDTEPVWTTKDGKCIPVSDMTTSHIENALAMLKRNGVVSPSTLEFYTTCEGPNGEMAQVAFENECRMVFSAPVHPAVDWFENELKKRKGEKL